MFLACFCAEAASPSFAAFDTNTMVVIPQSGSNPTGFVGVNTNKFPLTNQFPGIVANITNNFNVTLEQFGGRADGQKLVVQATATSATVSSTNADWTGADIGKPCELFQDSTNLSAVSTTIASINNSTSIVLNAASGASGNFLFKYGTDNTSAFTNALEAMTTNSGGVLYLQRGSYEFGGPFVLGNAGIYGVINLPATGIAISPTNNNNTYWILGCAPAMRAYSTQSNGPAMSGTILDLLSQPSNGGTNAFFSQMGPLGFVLEQFKFENVDIRQKMNPPAFGVYARWGGSIYFRDDAFDVEFPNGYTMNAPPVFTPTNGVVNTNATAAIWFPTTGNDANIGMDNILIFGYGIAFNATEHFKSSNLQIEDCGTAVYVENTDTDGGQSGIGSVIKGAHFYCASQPIQFAPANQVQPIDFQDIGLESHGLATADIYDPSNTAIGYLSYCNETWLGLMPTNLNTLNLDSGTQSGPAYQVYNIFGSELGSSPITADLIFDCNFNGVKVGTQEIFTDRSPSESAVGVSVSAFTNTPSPDGIGVTTLSGLGGINFPAATVSGNYTNFSVMLLVNSFAVTSGTLVIPVARPTGPSNFEIFYNNGNSIGYKITTVNGAVTATGTFAGGAGGGGWHALAMTYDGASIRGYCDGSQVGIASQTGAMSTPTGSFQIGSKNNDAVAHVRCWDRVLSSQEIYNYASQYGVASTNYINYGVGNGGGLTNVPAILAIAYTNAGANVIYSTNGNSITAILNTNFVNAALTNTVYTTTTNIFGTTNTSGANFTGTALNFITTPGVWHIQGSLDYVNASAGGINSVMTFPSTEENIGGFTIRWTGDSGSATIGFMRQWPQGGQAWQAYNAGSAVASLATFEGTFTETGTQTWGLPIVALTTVGGTSAPYISTNSYIYLQRIK